MMLYLPETHYLFLLLHYLNLNYLKRLCLVINSYWVHTTISNTVAIYVSIAFLHKLLYK